MKILSATAQASPDIAFIKFTLAKPDRTNRQGCFEGKIIFG
jgi:hypothetical protein